MRRCRLKKIQRVMVLDSILDFVMRFDDCSDVCRFITDDVRTVANTVVQKQRTKLQHLSVSSTVALLYRTE